MQRTSREWNRSPHRARLLALYAEVDELLAGWTCACSRAGVGTTPEAQCCHFGVTGREPYPTAVELEEVRHAMRAASVTPRDPRKLPMAELRPCPLLSPDGRCRIYASRPFGCRTFFCEHGEAPYGGREKLPRDAINAIGRKIADLSAEVSPRDPLPRPLVRALVG
ncbi:MAG TPA: YkgJ family cysteine cluster protein [Polyangiaceae bacterium]